MSADNIIAIFDDDDGKYRGYDRSMSQIDDYDKKNRGYLLFTAETMEEAVKKAQGEYAEYGFYFVSDRV